MRARGHTSVHGIVSLYECATKIARMSGTTRINLHVSIRKSAPTRASSPEGVGDGVSDGESAGQEISDWVGLPARTEELSLRSDAVSCQPTVRLESNPVAMWAKWDHLATAAAPHWVCRTGDRGL